jgi:hypothetical protein
MFIYTEENNILLITHVQHMVLFYYICYTMSMSKKYIFVLALSIIMLGTIASASFIEPTNSPQNTPDFKILKTGPEQVFKMKYPFAVGCVHSENTEIVEDCENGNMADLNKLIVNNGKYSFFVHKAGFFDTYVNTGTTNIKNNLTILNTDSTNKTSSTLFDQYKNISDNKFSDYLKDASDSSKLKQAKPVEANLWGRMLSKIIVTNDKNKSPTKDFEFQYVIGSSSKDVNTNIGLGDWCEVSKTEMESMGCPNGAYISMIDPTGKIGTDIITSGSNTNIAKYNRFYNSEENRYDHTGESGYTNYYNVSGTPYAWCTYLAPSKSPANIGKCYGKYLDYGGQNNSVALSINTSGSGSSCKTEVMYKSGKYNRNTNTAGPGAFVTWYKNGSVIAVTNVTEISGNGSSEINKCWSSEVDGAVLRTHDGRNFIGVK